MAHIPNVISQELCPVCNGTGIKESILDIKKTKRMILLPEPFDLEFCHNCNGTGWINIYN